jgi:pilus assembly protein CpaB
MWEVERMNTARIVVLALAIAAGGAAAYLASGSAPPAPDAPVVEKVDTVDVLIAKSDIGIGRILDEAAMQWQPWPVTAPTSNFIRRTDRPDAIKQLKGTIARSSFVAGEPIREQKLIAATGSGFMAAILPEGMRAMATEISVENAAGGFILPNDRVDVIQTRREKIEKSSGNTKSETEVVIATVVIEDVRVLAIDQAVEEKNGEKVVVGRTATLELAPEQTSKLAKARVGGQIVLALRSLLDADKKTAEGEVRTLTVVRFGVNDASR